MMRDKVLLVLIGLGEGLLYGGKGMLCLSVVARGRVTERIGNRDRKEY